MSHTAAPTAAATPTIGSVVPQPIAGGTYLDAVQAAWGHLAMWDFLRYDTAGDLWVNELRVKDALERYGSPLEIVDATIVETRARQWAELAGTVAAAVGYPGRLAFLYAGKANMASEVVHAAVRAGWGAETSAVQELVHLEWMLAEGLLPPNLPVVCNGFKLPPSGYGTPLTRPAPAAGAVELPRDGTPGRVRDLPYARRIKAMAAAGWNIQPILDAGELATFASADWAPLDVGLRLKFGAVTSADQHQRLVSRFGMMPDELAATAAAIDAVEHLRFTCLHAMVGAAETIPVGTFVSSLTYAGHIWARLRRTHPTLREFNMGGGIPPLGEDYDHRAFLHGLFAGLLTAANAADVPPPDVTFELGSLVASECGLHAFKVVQVKRNHNDPAAVNEWAIVDGGLMAAIPDMLLLGSSFRILAVTGANRPARPVRLGDLTCDGDGRYPPASFGPEAAVLLPDGPGPQWIVIQGVGAYQEILSGVRGAHHCGLLEAVELILERRADGRVHGRLMPRQMPNEAAAKLGYEPAAAAALRDAVPDAGGRHNGVGLSSG